MCYRDDQHAWDIIRLALLVGGSNTADKWVVVSGLLGGARALPDAIRVRVLLL
jgi:hypothetical protein